MKRLHDSLTGSPNSQALDEMLKERLEQSANTALALVDLDGLLGINQEFGDTTGDAILRKLAALLNQSAPDSVYRISGDEFAFVLDNITLEQAFLQMEQVRATVATASDHFALPDRRQMSVSIGVAHAPRDAANPRGLLRAAQAALQGAKENGRNQVGLPPNEEMVMKTCYYPASSVRRLQALAKRLRRKESHLFREALDDILRKYDLP